MGTGTPHLFSHPLRTGERGKRNPFHVLVMLRGIIELSRRGVKQKLPGDGTARLSRPGVSHPPQETGTMPRPLTDAAEGLAEDTC